MTDHLVLRVVAVAMFIIGSFPLSLSSTAAGQETPPAAEDEPSAPADEDAAAAEMRSHIEFLVPFYERAWRELTPERRRGSIA